MGYPLWLLSRIFVAIDRIWRAVFTARGLCDRSCAAGAADPAGSRERGLARLAKMLFPGPACRCTIDLVL